MAAAVYQTRNIEKLSNFLQDVQYHSLMVNSASFNVRLMRDRKTRLPFLDSQTGIAQNSCKLFMDDYQRMPGILFGQIYTYPAERWCRKRRSYMTIAYQTSKEFGESAEHDIATVENPPLSVMIEDSSNTSFENKPHEMFFYDETTLLEEEDDEPDNEDDDTYSMRNTKKRKKVPKPKPVPTKGTRGRKRRDPSTYKIITDADDDNPGKPYECALCGARYKTRQGLSYHLSHTHRGGASSSGTSASKNTSSIANVTEPVGSESSLSLNEQNYPYQEHPQSIVKQPDALSGLTEFQDNYLGYLSSGQDSNASASGLPTSNYDAVERRITNNDNISEEDSSPFKDDVPDCKLTRPERQLDISEVIYNDHENSIVKPPQRSDKIGEIASPNSYCDFCLGNPNFNIKTGEPEEMVSCADCGRSGHLTCLQFTSNMIISVRQYRWQCIECKCCTLCGTSENDDKLLFCDDCDRGYHLYCLEKPLLEPPEGEWSCHLCQTQFHTKNF